MGRCGSGSATERGKPAVELWSGDVGFVAELDVGAGNQGSRQPKWSLPAQGGAEGLRALPKAPRGAQPGSPVPGRGRGPSRTPAIGCSLSSAFPDPFPEAPPITPGARLGSREGSGRRREERGEVLARAPLAARARAARSRCPRRHLFPPSVRLSAVGFVRPPRRPSPPRCGLSPPPPSARRGPVPESPGPASPSCGWGPLSRGLSVRRRGPGTRSAEAEGKAPQRREPAVSVAPAAPRRRPPFVCPCLGRDGLGVGGGWVRASRAGV